MPGEECFNKFIKYAHDNRGKNQTSKIYGRLKSWDQLQQMVLNWVTFKTQLHEEHGEGLAYFGSQIIMNLRNQAVEATNTILSYFNRRTAYRTRETIILLDSTVNRTPGWTDHWYLDPMSSMKHMTTIELENQVKKLRLFSLKEKKLRDCLRVIITYHTRRQPHGQNSESNSRGENRTLKMAVIAQEILSHYKENLSHLNEMDSLGHPSKFPAAKNVPTFSKHKELRATCQGFLRWVRCWTEWPLSFLQRLY